MPLLPAPEPAALCGPEAAPPEGSSVAPAPPVASRDAKPPDPAEIAARLQAAVRTVLPAIEATVAKLAAGSMQPREMERAGRTLSALTRTLRELNDLLSRHQPGAAHDNDLPEDADAARNELVRRIEVFLASRTDDESSA